MYLYVSIPSPPLASTIKPPHTPLPQFSGFTPICQAARNGNTDAVKRLIAARCDVNLADTVKQMTPLALALALRPLRARLP